jgi:hypothetical protein
MDLVKSKEEHSVFKSSGEFLRLASVGKAVYTQKLVGLATLGHGCAWRIAAVGLCIS